MPIRRPKCLSNKLLCAILTILLISISLLLINPNFRQVNYIVKPFTFTNESELELEVTTAMSTMYCYCSLMPKPNTTVIVLNITIVVVVTDADSLKRYEEAQDALRCYSRIHGYPLIQVVISEGQYPQCTRTGESMLERHCIAAHILHNAATQWILSIDGDSGAVNPLKRLDDFLSPEADLIFSMRFHDGEVWSSYLARKSSNSVDFLLHWSNITSGRKLPLFSNGDNGMLHLLLLEKLSPSSGATNKCKGMWGRCNSIPTYDAFVGCVAATIKYPALYVHHRLMVLPRAQGWSRDAWTTGGNRFYKKEDVFLHAMKSPFPLVFSKPINITSCQSQSLKLLISKNGYMNIFPYKNGYKIDDLAEMKEITYASSGHCRGEEETAVVDPWGGHLAVLSALLNTQTRYQPGHNIQHYTLIEILPCILHTSSLQYCH